MIPFLASAFCYLAFALFESFALALDRLSPIKTRGLLEEHPERARILSGQIRRGDTETIHAAIWLADLRGFTQLSDTMLGPELIALLNSYFDCLVTSIHNHDGEVLNFMGDGLLAVFGQRAGIEIGCRQALRTVRAIDLALDHINAKLEAELGRPLQVGMGLDAGPLLLGRIGYGEAVDFTVIGNAVNVASRLEALSKEKGLQVMLAREVARQAGWEPAAEFTMQVAVRGVAEPVEVIGIARGRDLPASILAYTDDEEERPMAWTMGRWGGA